MFFETEPTSTAVPSVIGSASVTHVLSLDLSYASCRLYVSVVCVFSSKQYVPPCSTNATTSPAVADKPVAIAVRSVTSCSTVLGVVHRPRQSASVHLKGSNLHRHGSFPTSICSTAHQRPLISLSNQCVGALPVFVCPLVSWA